MTKFKRMAANSASGPVPVASPVEIQESSSLHAFISGISKALRSSISHCRPWLELLDRSAFSKPESISEAAHRIRKNCSYFRGNYLGVIAAVIAFSLLTHPFSLFLLAGLVTAWTSLYLLRQPSDPPITVFERKFSDREMLAVLIVCTIVVIFLTSVGTLLVSAAIAGVMIDCAHGAFRVPDNHFLDLPDAHGGAPNLLSLLIGGVPNPAVSEPLGAARA